MKRLINCKQFKLLIGFFLFTCFVQAQSITEQYIASYDSLAMEVMNTYGIPASLILGIAIQESAAGTSKLGRINNNHFGLRGRVKSSKSKSGYVMKYLKFDSEKAGYLYFAEMISRRKYYDILKHDMDYMKWLKAMKAAKFALSSSWISHVSNMIKRYNLTRFDSPDSKLLNTIPAIPDSIDTP